MISDDERKKLLARARAAIAQAVQSRVQRVEASRLWHSPIATIDGVEMSATAPLDGFCAGAFVTIRSRGELRGCIGRIEADLPLLTVIEQCAVSACVADPRFDPVSFDELSELTIEISVLGELEPLGDLSTLEVGRHGLFVKQSSRQGLLLPQVAPEWNWDRETFLAQTCLKAGLLPDAWQRGAEVFRFEAEVFGEGEPS